MKKGKKTRLDFIIKSRSLTIEEEFAISEHIRAYKLKNSSLIKISSVKKKLTSTK